MSLAQVLLVASIAALLQSVWKTKSQLKLTEVCFNIATIQLSTIAAYHLPRLFVQSADQPVALVLSASTFFLVNSGLVSLVISVAEKQSVERLWRQWAYLWSFLYYLVGAGVTGAVTSSTHQVGWKASMFILPVMY